VSDSSWVPSRLLGAIGCALLPLFLVASSGSGCSGSQPTVTRDSPAWAKLAMIQAKSPNPPRSVVHRFEVAFGRLEVHCPDTPERLGDFIMAGHDQLAEAGLRTSLLDLTQGVATFLDSAAATGSPPKMDYCAEAVALVVVVLKTQ